MDQTIESDGTFYTDPELGDYEIQRFQPEEMKDDFYNINWTVEGRIGALDVLYTGAFTDRETEQNIDYTDYLYIGQYIPYYICDYYVSYTSFSPAGAGIPSGTCQSPSLAVGSTSTSEVSTHEVRFTTPADASLRVTAGVFYSDMEFTERNDFTYHNSQYVDVWGAGKGDGFGFAPNSTFSSPGYRSGTGPFPAGVIFRNDIKRTDEQVGVFGEASFDISDQFTITAGLRWYDYEVDFEGSANSSFCGMSGEDRNSYGTDINDLYDGDGQFTWIGTCSADKTTYSNDSLPDASDPNYDRIVNSINAPDNGSDDGVIGKVSLSWTPNDDSLWYVTWSEGYRPGLLNRPGGAYQAATDYTVPFDVQSDELTNLELGWKLDLMDGAMRLNGSIFSVDIEGLQTTIFDTSIVNLFFSDNAADAEVTGLEADLTWLASEGLTIRAALSLLDTEVTDVLIPTGDVIEGSELAYAPEVQGNISARYVWETAGGLTAHVMPSISYSAESYSDIIAMNRDKLDSWTLVGITAGVTNDEWMVEAFIDNLTEEEAATGANYVNDRSRFSLARPRTVGMRFSYHF
jgi:outer membrane receptor protein involved in Fe transport